MTVIHGMAVLMIRILFLIISYYIFEKVNWKLFFTERNDYMAFYLCLIISLAIGHLLGSLIITIIELLQKILFAGFL